MRHRRAKHWAVASWACTALACGTVREAPGAVAEPAASPRPPSAPAPALSPEASVTASALEPPAASTALLRCLQRHTPGARVTPGADGGLGLDWAGRWLPLEDGRALDETQRLDAPDLRALFEPRYPALAPLAVPQGDPGRVRLEPLLEAQYGTPAEASRQLVKVMLAGRSVRIHSRAAKALERVAARLEPLLAQRPELASWFQQMGGSYNDRRIAGTERKSAHAYGIAIDVSVPRSDYWRHGAVDGAPPPYRNRVPEALVHAFEAEQFVWGGRWRHFDTMHFEYRPELFDVECIHSAEALPARGVRAATAVAHHESTSAKQLALAAPAAAQPSPSYAWSSREGALPPHDRLDQRFAPPEGFAWDVAEPGSFAAYLRTLPLAAPGTPVRSHRGELLVEADDPRLAAVSTLDIGKGDLQQCADAVLRLHAEYNYIAKQDAVISYSSASGVRMPFSRWVSGERLKLQGKELVWTSGGAGGRGYDSFRSYLNKVFAYANTVSIAKDAKVVARGQLRAGDFFVQGGWPGHAVLVLAVASSPRGERAALIGQSYMPAQNFHVVKSHGASSAWISLDEELVSTPFWRAFAWSDLRRLP